MFLKILYSFFIVVILISCLTSCSSSSTSERYRKPKEAESDEQSSSVRFTSKENNSKQGKTEYSNMADSLAEFDEFPVEDNPVSKDEFLRKYEKIESFSAALTTREKILFEIINYLDTPYLYGGINKNGIDCSAFTQNVFSHSVGLKLPRTAREQFRVGDQVNRNQLKFGDLLFFNTTSRSYPGHVGIYMGENLFAHASRSLGVTVSSLESTYYKTRYIGARRVK